VAVLGRWLGRRRAEVVRRVTKDEEQIIQLNLDAIFAGTAPDFYVKPNDIVNVGRMPRRCLSPCCGNAFRFSYAWVLFTTAILRTAIRMTPSWQRGTSNDRFGRPKGFQSTKSALSHPVAPPSRRRERRPESWPRELSRCLLCVVLAIPKSGMLMGCVRGRREAACLADTGQQNGAAAGGWWDVCWVAVNLEWPCDEIDKQCRSGNMSGSDERRSRRAPETPPSWRQFLGPTVPPKFCSSWRCLAGYIPPIFIACLSIGCARTGRTGS